MSSFNRRAWIKRAEKLTQKQLTNQYRDALAMKVGQRKSWWEIRGSGREPRRRYHITLKRLSSLWLWKSVDERGIYTDYRLYIPYWTLDAILQARQWVWRWSKRKMRERSKKERYDTVFQVRAQVYLYQPPGKPMVLNRPPPPGVPKIPFIMSEAIFFDGQYSDIPKKSKGSIAIVYPYLIPPTNIHLRLRSPVDIGPPIVLFVESNRDRYISVGRFIVSDVKILPPPPEPVFSPTGLRSSEIRGAGVRVRGGRGAGSSPKRRRGRH